MRIKSRLEDSKIIDYQQKLLLLSEFPVVVSPSRPTIQRSFGRSPGKLSKTYQWELRRT